MNGVTPPQHGKSTASSCWYDNNRSNHYYCENYGMQRGSEHAISRSIRIQYSLRSKAMQQDLLEQQQSVQAMQYQYDMATWKMQDRILRHREKHSPSEVSTEEPETSTEIGYYDDDDSSCLEEDNNKPKQQTDDEPYYPRDDDSEEGVFQMDLWDDMHAF